MQEVLHLAAVVPHTKHTHDGYPSAATQASTAETSRLFPVPLTKECPDCEDGIRYTSKYGGNDPDVWADGPCETCDGSGIITLCCDTCSDHDAVAWFDGNKFCAVCLAEQRADAIEVHIGTIETLTTWCREHVRPPPADLLYRAANAVDCLRGVMATERNNCHPNTCDRPCLGLGYCERLIP